MPEVLDISNFQLETGTTLIDASAGTGKTYTIQYVVLDLLLKGVPIAEILVVTFTEAATKELKDRIQSFLVDVNDRLTNHEDKKDALGAVLTRAIGPKEEKRSDVTRLIRKAMLEVDQAAVYTIHGFCQRSLQEYAFAADANLDMEVCKDVRSLVTELVCDFTRLALLEMDEPFPKLPRLTPQQNTWSQIDLLNYRAMKLTGLLRVSDPYEGEIGEACLALESAIQAVENCQSERDLIEKDVADLRGRMNGGKFKAAFVGNGKLSRFEKVLMDPRGAKEADLNFLIVENFKFNAGKDTTPPEHPFFAACEQLLAAKKDYLTRFFRCFDTWFIKQFRALLIERSLLSFNDMILELDRALQTSQSLKSKLQEKYRAALVDEFQDTDSRQYSIFRQLFGAGEETGHYFAMIGDPKQSIYRFRGADIAAYLSAREHTDYSYTLLTNHRSDQKMVEAINLFFKDQDFADGFEGDDVELIRDDEDPSIDFQPVNAADNLKERLVFEGEFEACRLYERPLDYNGEGKVSDAHASTVNMMAADLRQLLKWSEDGRVYFESMKDGVIGRRAIQAGDIAILVDSHYEADQVQNALRKEGVLAVRSKSGSIIQANETRQFICFLMACLKPVESILNVLLVRDFYGKKDAEMKSLSDSERRAVYEQFSIYGKQWREGNSISSIWLDFVDKVQLRERLIGVDGGERKLTNYMHISEYAQELERVESLSPDRLLDRLSSIVQGGDRGGMSEDEYPMRLESDDSAVAITTMHSSKGLEYPITFLPSLWQRPVKSSEKQDVYLLHSENDQDAYHSLSKNPLAQFESSAEVLRLGYVAMTRAVHFCVYYNARDIERESHKKNSNHYDGWFDEWLRMRRNQNYNNGYANRPNEGFLLELNDVTPTHLAALEEEPTVKERKLDHAIPQSYQITSYSALARSELSQQGDVDPSVPAGMDDVPVEPSESTAVVQETAAISDLLLSNLPPGARTGTCVHEALERCDFSDPDQWSYVVRAAVKRHFPEGDEALLELRVSDVVELITRLTQQPQVNTEGLSIDLSELKPKACIPEMEFYFPVEQVDVAKLELIIQTWAQRVGLDYQPTNYRARSIDGYLTGSVDLFFTQGGRYVLLDWKTNKPLPGHAKLQRSYDRNGMHAHMSHGRYYLQALIYSVATAAYLRNRLGPRFDWETHIGGFVYCYVRGVGEGTGWLHESFSEAEVQSAADALGQLSHTKGVV
jgi:exodeoxyribonuclease V beta subunit